MDILDDSTSNLEVKPVEAIKNSAPKTRSKKVAKEVIEDNTSIIPSCLRNEVVYVKHIDKPTGLVTNKKHVLYGGMASTSVRRFTVPLLKSGMYTNILTDSEKSYLEDVMGLEYNALSIYNKKDNFWDDDNPIGISTVSITKDGIKLDLSNPEDYIRYKILLANKNLIAPSTQELRDKPKETYEFVMTTEQSDIEDESREMSTLMECYKNYGKYENNFDVLKTIVESIDSRPIAINTKIAFLQAKCNNLIQKNGKLFKEVITDPLLMVKVDINKGVVNKVISKRGNYYYLAKGNLPLCESNQDPTLTNAAMFLNSPKHQEIKFSIEALNKA